MKTMKRVVFNKDPEKFIERVMIKISASNIPILSSGRLRRTNMVSRSRDAGSVRPESHANSRFRN